MSVEGIFRKNGNIRRLKDLSDAIDRDPQSVDLTQDNAVQLAALLKKFLRDLPEPLMTVKLFKLFTSSQSEFIVLCVQKKNVYTVNSAAFSARPSTVSTLYFAYTTQITPGYYGNTVCFLEVGGVFCARR